MTIAWAITAFLIPWAVGIAIFRLWCSSDAHWSLAAGAGWLIGQILVMATLYGLLRLTDHSHARWLLGIFTLAAVLLWLLVAIRTSRQASSTKQPSIPPDSSNSGGASRLSWLRKIVFFSIGSSLFAKLVILAAGHVTIPSRSDDAISIWLFKAKVIATLDRIPRDPSADYYMAGSNPHYPLFAPLLAAWGPLVVGHWSEQLATAAWLGFYLNLILLIAGGLRYWLSSLAAWSAAYLVASLPLLVVHAYRPGYVDLLLAAFLAATVLYLKRWRVTGRFRDGLLAGVFAIAVACMKREGPPLAAVVVLAVVAASWRMVSTWSWRQRLAHLSIVILAVAMVMRLVDTSDVVRNIQAFEYHPEIIRPLVRHLLDWSSFHFLYWLLIPAYLCVLLMPDKPQRWPCLLIVAGLCGLDICIFLLTPQAVFAMNDQTPSRLFLQISPAIILSLAIPLAAGLGPVYAPRCLEDTPHGTL